MAVYLIMRSYTGILMMLGKGHAQSVKQKLNTRSPTKTEMIVIDVMGLIMIAVDAIGLIMWMKHFWLYKDMQPGQNFIRTT